MKATAQNQNTAARIRRQYSAEEKVRLLRLHLVEGQPISTICDLASHVTWELVKKGS